jgi:hypothetical protein
MGGQVIRGLRALCWQSEISIISWCLKGEYGGAVLGLILIDSDLVVDLRRKNKNKTKGKKVL